MSGKGLDDITIFKKLRDDLNEKRLDEGKPMLTGKDLAKKFSVSEGTISNIEKGERPPSYEVLKSYHKFFNVPYETLMGEGGIAKKPEHVIASAELGLSDEALDTIKSLTPDLLEMLNALISNGRATALLLHSILTNLHDFHLLSEQPQEYFLCSETEYYTIKRTQFADSIARYLLDQPYNKLKKQFKRIDKENEYLATIPPEELFS